MKKILLIIVIFLPALMFGQSDHFSNRNAIKISPVEFGKAEFQIAYERYFGDRSSSITISPSIILKENNYESKEGFQIGGQYRIFLSHIKSDSRRIFLGFHNIGVYTGLYAQYQDYKEDYKSNWWDMATDMQSNGEFTKKISATEGGAIIGVQIDITKRILIDFFVGGGVRYSDITDSKDGVVDENQYYEDYSVFDPEYKGVKPKIGFQLGVLF
jgi:hypothetical protein